MKITTAQIAVTAIGIAVIFGLIVLSNNIMTQLIDSPATHWKACLISGAIILLLGLIILAKSLRAASDIHLTDLDYKPHDFESSSLSSFTSYPGRTDCIIKTAQEFTALERRQKAIAEFQDHYAEFAVKSNSKQVAKRFGHRGPLGETLN